MSRTLVITQKDDGHFTLFNGTHVSDSLQSDEALGCCAQFLMMKDQAMRYGTAVESYWEMERRIREEIYSKLRPVDRLLLKEKSA